MSSQGRSLEGATHVDSGGSRDATRRLPVSRSDRWATSWSFAVARRERWAVSRRFAAARGERWGTTVSRRLAAPRRERWGTKSPGGSQLPGVSGGAQSLQEARSCQALAEGSQVHPTRLQGRRRRWRHHRQWVMLGVGRSTANMEVSDFFCELVNKMDHV
jgi:hypothetical protein